MSDTAVPSSPSPAAIKVLNLLRAMPADALDEVKAKLIDKAPASKFSVPRTKAGGIAEALPLDDVLERVSEIDDEERSDRANDDSRSYFSKIGECHRKQWMKAKKLPGDDGKALDDPTSAYRFDPGNSTPGHATENHVQLLMEKVYTKGKPGAVLKDIRMSEILQVECEAPDGTTKRMTISVAGKSDIVIVGDNLEILDFMELKSPVMWTKNKTKFIEQHGKIVTLAIAGIGEPLRSDGIANLNNTLQLAIGVQILRNKGHAVRKATLLYVNRERYREHIAILLTEADVELLYDLAVWWTTEHHIHLQSDTPPPALFMMGWECNRCPFLQRCTALNAGESRKMHPAIPGINSRLDAANNPVVL